ncbi:MAG: hypothetical protein H7Z42_00770 [Roseiflexaceae bacterium]|nr:hypothetical protein [Roseiflexaceae bacterium]
MTVEKPISPVQRTPRPDRDEIFATEDDRRWTGLADPAPPNDQRRNGL